jgi:nucleotide-binding universal stress UspA family protein
MKTIIISTDFSTVAHNAMNYGVELAKSIGHSVTLVHVYQVPVAFSDGPLVMVSLDDLRSAAEKQLNQLRSDLHHVHGKDLKIYSEAILGNVVEEVQNLAEKLDPFAVVMGATGLTGAQRVLFGSTTLLAVRQLKHPVIVVPEGKSFGHGIKKIGLACDFREVVDTTPTRFVQQFQKTFKAELHVINVDFENRHFRPDTPEQSLMLQTLLGELNPTYHFIEEEDIEAGINRFAEENNLDLLITIPKKHRFIEDIFKRSSTKHLLKGARVPVVGMH